MHGLASVVEEIVRRQSVAQRKKSENLKYPKSYNENTNKEKLLLWYVENFWRQYTYLYTDRKPLFLAPLNECGIPKFVSTTISPTLLPYPELYDWHGCAQFVADHLVYEPLELPTDLPKTLDSPAAVLQRQRGNCFDYSMLLCSLLIGAGYNAFVVSGYATRAVCSMDGTRDICPMLMEKPEEKRPEVKKVPLKYAVKPPRELYSKYEAEMAEVERKKKEEEEVRIQQEYMEKIAELQKPPPDPMFGLRIHCWVLVLAGKREVADSFFIEPPWGEKRSLTHTAYLGIESIWNNQNYWVNMQDCSNGCQDLRYNLEKLSDWESLLVGDPGSAGNDVEEKEGQLEEEGDKDTGHYLDMPLSWVKGLAVHKQAFELRYPEGLKTRWYKQSKLEEMAPYLVKDGLVRRLTQYSDEEWKEPSSVKEYYHNRADKQIYKEHNLTNNWIIEKFAQGRPNALKEHQYKCNNMNPEDSRKMAFYHQARVDGLHTRDVQLKEMIERFVGRQDFLYLRQVVFGDREKKFGPAEVSKRVIQKITERFHRNPERPAREDIAERVFHMVEDRIQLTFQREEGRIIASTREFTKPPADERGDRPVFCEELSQGFQVDNVAPKKLDLFLLAEVQTKAEQKALLHVRDSEEEASEMLTERMREIAVSELEISVFDTKRNENVSKGRKEMERLKKEESARNAETELDYLAPFLTRLGNPEYLTQSQSCQVRDECLADLKQRLVDRANQIQLQFEKVSETLQAKQQWYKQNQNTMTKEDEEEYNNFCSSTMFQLHVLEQRLARHKDQAPQEYLMLEQRLHNDPRL